MTTSESLTTTVGLSLYRVDVQALMTGLRRIGRRDKDNLNASTKSFILNEHSQLVKRPTVGASTLGLVPGSLVGSFPNSRQVFYGD
jgi:hypothetical protein